MGCECPLDSLAIVFELFCRFGAPGQGGLGVHINRNADAVAPLAGGDLRIDPGVVAETGVGPAPLVIGDKVV